MSKVHIHVHRKRTQDRKTRDAFSFSVETYYDDDLKKDDYKTFPTKEQAMAYARDMLTKGADGVDVREQPSDRRIWKKYS